MLIINKTGYWDGKEAHLHHGYSQPLVDWIINYLQDQKDKQIYDFGCGVGQYLQQLQAADFTKLTGFEGDVPHQKVFNDIRKQDLTQSFNLPVKGNCIFLEVAEHIPAQYEIIALKNVVNACDNILVTSWATRGQGGYGHVNELNNDEAIDRFVKLGMTYLPDETKDIRSKIHPTLYSIPDCQLFWFKNTTLIFKRG